MKRYLRLGAVVMFAWFSIWEWEWPVYAADQRYLNGDTGPNKMISLGGRAMYFRATDSNDGDLFGGAQLRLYLTRLVNLEGSADYRRSDFPGSRVDVFPVQASLILHLIPGSFISPFILGGAGWYFTRVDGPGNFDETTNRFGPHAGGGIQIFINPYWSIDATYRHVWVEDIKSRDETNLANKDFKDTGHMATVGLNLHF